MEALRTMNNSAISSSRVVVFRRLSFGLVLALFVGCASTPLQLPSAGAISAAREAGTLESIFSDLKLRSAIDPSAAKLSREIGAMIGEDKFSAVLVGLENAAIEGLVPVGALNSAAEQVQVISKYNGEYAEQLNQYLSESNSATQEFLNAASASVSDVDANIGEQLDYARVLSALNGEDATALSDKLLSNAYNTASNFEASGDYASAYDRWKALVGAAPDYQDSKARLNNASSAFNLGRFNTLMEAGDVTGATTLYTQLATDGVDLSPLEDAAGQLVAYFALQAETALDDEVLGDAYSAAKMIRQLEAVGAGNQDNEIATAVLEALILRSELYVSQDRPGMALGSALAASDLAPNDPITQDLATRLIDQLYDRSITRLSLGSFSGTSEFPQLGNRISSLIKEKLVASELNTIRLIERDKLQAVFVEKELLAMKGGDVNTTVEPADIVVQGEILAARIDESREDRRKKKRVVVEIELLPNPAYAEWSDLSDSKKSKTTEPEEFTEKKIKEDVTVISTILRKDGFLSAAYRLINPVSANIMSYQSLEELNQYTGEATEGLEIGLFIQESIVAEIPSDGQVVAELAEKVSNKVADQLITRFSDPVAVFTSEADAYLAKEEVVSAAFELGKAYSFGLKTVDEDSVLGKQLRDLALYSNAYIEE